MFAIEYLVPEVTRDRYQVLEIQFLEDLHLETGQIQIQTLIVLH